MTFTKVRLWTVEEYHRMIEAGILTPSDRVELLQGQIVRMSPQLPPHASTTQRTARYLDRLLAEYAYVRMQLPVTLKPNSEPEPDIAIVRFDLKEYVDRHPAPDDISLIIEVADTSLQDDRTIKAPLYARAGIPEYWILDVNTRQVYVFRDPQEDGYTQEVVLTEENTLSPIAFPDISISFNQLFP
ncbi:Uma2 family endonuclease [Kovacikia minuta CCNUW1]|uniref:Uma2 family endonuclease n=1 Tax=Kovacikia minuta TaxID=2931930 RepID=UPI001CCE67DF|nr:Uma2 family endonuclease [Kovacikia minuta]UBF25732.1 Uma2 family endonuclease [Kovacikia minuta CCNUW1]